VFPAENDYNPIVDEGKIERASGILGRRRARQSVPVAGHGEEVVLLGANGGLVSGKGETTAGERYWGSSRGWIVVDISDHHLYFRITYQDTDGAAGYEISAVATVTVADAPAAVRRKARGVRAYVEPALRSTATRHLSGSMHTEVDDTLKKFNLRLGGHTDVLRGLIGGTFQVGDWLSVTITDLSIQFDSATAVHYEQLIAADRTGEVKNRTIKNQTQTAKSEIELRETWAEYLGKQMSDPLRRAVAEAAADPTPDNIREVANKLDEDDRWQRNQFLATLNRLIDNKVIVELDDVRNTRVIIDSLQKALTADGDSRSRPEKMIAGTSVTDDPEPSSGDYDRYWGN
jgi:hypothetical protein